MRPNLFICLTPLQALIAQALIRQSAPVPADLLMVCYAEADNAKYRHYFQATAALCRRADYVLIPQGRWQRELVLPLLIKNLDKQYATIFAASIDNPTVQYPLSHLKFERLETFDDGTANLYPSSILYHNPPQTLKRKIINCLQGMRYQTEDLRQLSQQHHTLYPNQRNIVAHTKPLTLWQPENKTPFSGSLKTSKTSFSVAKTEKIWLGQPIFADETRNVEWAQKIMQHYEIQNYFPHPRETLLPENIALIETPLIFEDWLLQQIQSQPETEFELYHLASSAAMNVAQFPRVRVHAIRPNHEYFRQPAFVYLYDLMPPLSISVTEFAL
ncbi:glycosyltransferase family 52 [Neisseriaceae bacterium B1]